MPSWPEYQVIAAHYGERRARRSKQRLMKHIDEGIALLGRLGASERAARAFCLHPIVQSDDDLAAADLDGLTREPAILALAMEYRAVANDYLSPMGHREPEQIRLSPLAEVGNMLRADKVQNYADFLIYHRDSHPRADALDDYFRCWLRRLKITPGRFEQLRARLSSG